MLCGTSGLAAAEPATGTDTPLLQPTSVAYDATGNLYFAESRNNVVRRLGVDGTLTTVAGSFVQGFGGDNGDAGAAELDAPRGVALDGQGNLYIADTHNNRVRRVDAQTHVMTTVAGTGAGDFSGDGGLAGAAHLREPLALALDGNHHLYVADSGNQRVRSIDLVTGVISTVVGNGRQGFSGEGGPAVEAALDAPSGLVLDGSGDLFVADAGNRRVREVSSATRQIVTVAGATGASIPLRRPEGLSFDANGGLLISDAGNHCVYRLDLATGQLSVIAGRGVQAFGGDQGLATLAMLDTPMGVAVSPGGGLAISDSGNARVRMVASGGTITTIAGVGSKLGEVLQISGLSVQSYGSATLSASASSSTAVSGNVALFLGSQGQTQPVAQAALSNGTAVFDLSGLAAGSYQIYGVCAGDATHSGATSAVSTLRIQPLAVQLVSAGWSMVYGSALPTISTQLSGVLPRDQGSVGVTSVVGVTTGASALAPGVYPVTSTLTGAAAGNYVMSGSAGELTVTKAPVQVSLSETADALQIRVVSSTSGSPTGAITLLTSAGSAAASLPLGSGGTATVAFSGLTAGSYLMSAVYTGDADFLAGQSSQVSVIVGGSGTTTSGTVTDFALTSASASSVTAPVGGSAIYSLQVRPTGTALSAPILLSVSGLPIGATASFSPSLVPPGTPASVVALTVQLPQSSARGRSGAEWTGVSLATVLLFGLPGVVRPCGRSWRLLSWALLLVVPLGLSGCGDRVAPSGSSQAAQSYALVVTATATQANGSALQHSTTLTLTVP